MQLKQLFVLILAFLALQISVGQERYKTSEGVVSIDASSPLEDIKAVNNKVNAILDTRTGEMAVVLLIKDFEFRRRLMQEHFNENYMHSDKYPKAIFTGTIPEFDLGDISSQNSTHKLEGEITIHGITRPLSTDITLRKNEKGVVCSLEFIIRTEEHKIKVPRVVFKKVAQEVNVTSEFHLDPQ